MAIIYINSLINLVIHLFVNNRLKNTKIKNEQITIQDTIFDQI